MGAWVALPVLWGIWLVWAYGTNVVYNDEWSLVPLFRGVIEGGAGWAELWRQSNEHRIFFPRLALLGIAWLTDYDTKVQMFVSQLWALLAYGTYLGYLGSIRGLRGRWKTGFGLLAGVACYNTMQYENFLWGFQMAFLMVLGFGVFGLHCLHRSIREEKRGWLAAALAAGTVASFSSLQGLLIWPVYVATLLAAALESRRHCARGALVAGGYGLLAVAAYFAGYEKPGWSPEYLGGGVGNAVGYYLAAAGGVAAARYAWLAAGMGVLACVLDLGLGVDLARRGRIRENAFAIGLILFSHAFAAALAIGRVDEGGNVAHAMTSRYSTFGLLNYVGMLLIRAREREHWLCAKREGRAGRMAGVLLLGMFSAIVAGKCALYLAPSGEWRRERRAEAAVIRNYREASREDLARLEPFRNADLARQYVEQLEGAGWNVFAE